MIGNDIVDLSLAKTESNWERKGFLEKQFTTTEQILIHNSKNPFEMVWRIWSMKESAYKIVVQQKQKRFFAPKKFECSVLSEIDGEVYFENQRFQTKTISTHNYIYTSIGKSQNAWIGASENYKLEEMIANKLSILKVKIRKNDVGIPQIYCFNKQISESFTKSHHGNHLAFEVNFKTVKLQ